MERCRLDRPYAGATLIRVRPGRALAGLALVLAVAASGCGGAPSDAAAGVQAPVVPGETTQGPDLSGVQLPNFVMPLIHGAVSLPNSELTPGAITTTDAISDQRRPMRSDRTPSPTAPIAVPSSPAEKMGPNEPV